MMSAMPDKQALRESNDVFGKPIQCVSWFDRHLAGFSHDNKKGLDRLQLIKKLEKGSKLVLVPEPDNPFDRNAILLYTADDLENDIGYLDATGAKQICGLIERGATFSAQVFYVWYERPNVPFVRILIHQLTPALQNHRPVRKGAPVYKQAPPFPLQNERTEMQPKGEPVGVERKHDPIEVKLTEIEPAGIWSTLRRFFGI